MSKVYRKFLFVVVILGCSSACSTNANRPFTEEQVVQIYVATEFSSPSEAEKVIDQYGLSNDSKRRSYYKIVRSLTDTPEKYEEFLKKVEVYKQNQMAESAV